MALRKRCLDTYAIIEIYKGNNEFSDVLDSPFVIPDIIMAEFYGVLLRKEGEDVAEYWLKRLEPYVVAVELSELIEGIKFRYEHRKNRISFFDAVGYVYSLMNGYRFMTGDKEFEKFKHVEFRKSG